MTTLTLFDCKNKKQTKQNKIKQTKVKNHASKCQNKTHAHALKYI